MRVIASIEPGPAWHHGKSVYGQGEPIRGHLAAMASLYDRGRLLLGGPFETASSGVAVLDVDDVDEARTLMNADPAVMAGVLSYRIDVLCAFFDAFTGTRTAAPAGREHGTPLEYSHRTSSDVSASLYDEEA